MRSRVLACSVLPALLFVGLAALPSRGDATPKAAAAAADDDFAKELPRIPPLSPQEALGSFQVLPGFRIEQVAAEPLIHDPVAMSFDENGRMYVIEMLDYSEQANDFLGMVRILEDTDQDGRFDRSHVFIDKLSWPTAVCCYDGGVFIGAAPDLLYCKDTDGDGKADVRKVLFTGFGRGNVQGLMNSLHWTLDNRIQGATSSSGAQIRKGGDESATPIVLSGRDFSFDPRTLDFTPVSGGAQHGLTFDDWGRKFVCSNSDHIQMVMFEDRYLARNKFLAAPSARTSIAADGPQAEVYRTSPVEPWRIVRTRLRISGVAPGMVEGGGRAAGYFTGATGTTIYRGSAWPGEYRGQAFVGDVGSNIIHRKVLEPNGVGFVARRVDEKREFVTSRDIWFRPAQFANAPDGCLYIADVYREVIEHPLSLPPQIKKHLDLTSGRDRGRIYRLVPDGFQQPKLPRLGSASTAELVAALSDRNGWTRDTAARLLYQRQDQAAVAPLQQLASAAAMPEARMHALYALRGLGRLTGEAILPRLSDDHPRVREHAVRLSETLAAESPEIRARWNDRVNDADTRVRYQLAFSLGELPGVAKNALLAALLKRDAGDRWIRLAVFSSLAEGAGDVLALVAADSAFRETAPGREAIEQLALLIGSQAKTENVAAVLQLLEKLSAADGKLSAGILRGLGEGLAKSGSQLRERIAASGGTGGTLLRELVASSLEQAQDEKRSLAERADAVRTLGLGNFADARELLATLLGSRQPQELQLASIQSLGRFTEPDVAAVLIAAWPTLTPKVRVPATEALFSRPAWLTAFLDAVAREEIPLSDVEPARIKLLESSSNAEIKQAAQGIAGKLKLGKRQDVLAAYQPALKLAGDIGKGKAIFQKICANCHRMENVGYEIGPNLATIKNRGPDAILLNVLDPNREVNPQYVNYVIVTEEGKSITGMIAAETATSVTLKRQENASDTVLRVNIDEMRSTGMSLMPEGIEKQIDPQGLADLIAYLTSLK